MGTVAIRRASGKQSLIAEDTYDPAVHTLWDAPGAADDAPGSQDTPVPAPAQAPAPVKGTWGGKRTKKGA